MTTVSYHMAMHDQFVAAQHANESLDVLGVPAFLPENLGSCYGS